MKKGHRYAPDITGQKFGKLTAIKIYKVKRNGHTTSTYWLCECECGNFTSVEASRLRTGYTKSCGCLRNRKNKNGVDSPDSEKLYRIWIGMKTRCYNPKAGNYKYYGGKGVSVCDEWKDDFKSFYTWAKENGYKKNLTIDRIDTNKDYEPSNCRWITQKEQTNNTSQNVLIEYMGETHTLSEWVDILGLSYKTVYSRIYSYGWEPKKAFETPIRKIKKKEK